MLVGTAWLLAELVALFFGVAFAIHLLQRRVGPDRLRAWMGGAPLVAALKGIALGFVTPFCTFSAIPMLVGFRRAGVPPAGMVAFISAAPVLDPVLFGALVVIVGIEAALVYSAVAFVAALGLALTAQRVGIDGHLKPLAALGADPVVQPAPSVAVVGGSMGRAEVGAGVGDPRIGPAVAGNPVGAASDGTAYAGTAGSGVACAAACDGTDASPWQGWATEARGAAVAAGALLRSVAALLVIGVTVGLVIEATVSPATVATITGDNGAWSIPVAAVLGTPLYFHTGLFVPIADALTTAGVGIGAIVALTISGAGANVPEFVLLTKLAHRRLIAVFFVHVFGVALAGGLIAHALLG